MTKRSTLPQTRRHILVFDEDWELLQRLYGEGSESRLGVSAAVREIVHAKCQQLRQQLANRRDARQNPDDSAAALDSPPT